jgi:hypothetical protein
MDEPELAETDEPELAEAENELEIWNILLNLEIICAGHTCQPVQ